MSEALWQLLQERPSELTCDECFAVMDYYAELLARGGEGFLPEVRQHLAGCPSCRMEHRAALRRLLKEQEQEDHPAYKKQATVINRERDEE